MSSAQPAVRYGRRVWVYDEGEWHKATVILATKTMKAKRARIDSGKIIEMTATNVRTMQKEDVVLSGLERVRPSPSVGQLRERCAQYGYECHRKRKHELVELLLPCPSGKTLAEDEERYFLGVRLPCPSTPFALPVKAPPRVVQARGTTRHIEGGTRGASVANEFLSAM